MSHCGRTVDNGTRREFRSDVQHFMVGAKAQGNMQHAGKGQVLYGGLTLSVGKLDIASIANLQSGTEWGRT